jgi:Spondin_N
VEPASDQPSIHYRAPITGSRKERTKMQSTNRRLFTTAAALSCLGAVATAAAANSAAAPVRYQVVFERTWSAETHPQDFPLLGHFSPVIGVTHNGSYEPFRAGATATAGLEHLCEEGNHQPLDGEIRSAVANGDAGALIETAEPLRSVPGKATASFEIDAAHPMVSIAAMIAPSPDWCAIAADVALFENGAWVARKTVVLEAWDAGTDSASSYRALDADAQPRTPIRLNELPYFVKDGKRVPVGSVTFTRQ